MEIINGIVKQFRPNEPLLAQELFNENEDVEQDKCLINTSSKRSLTDVPFLVLHGVCVAILAIFLGYSIINGDIDRLTKGYDNCGNVCGKNNNFHIYSQKYCKAQDMTKKPFLYINGSNRQCVEHCPNEEVLSSNWCVSNKVEADDEQNVEAFIQGLATSLYKRIYDIIWLSMIAVGFASVMLLMIRYFAKAFVWFLLFGMLLVFIAGAVFFGNLASTEEIQYERDSSIQTTILCSIVALAMLFIIFRMKKHIDLLVQLLTEAGKSISTMPLLLIEPSLTFISLAIIWSAWFYVSLWIESGGTGEELVGKVTFVPSTFMIVADLYNAFMMLWMVQFVCGCQNMIVGGAVSTWYFARNKCQLGRPIHNSARNLLKYHLGTVSVISLVIALIPFVKLLVSLLSRALRFATCIMHCLNYVEQWIIYYTKNSSIITAMYGYPFHKAGSRAFKLIVENLPQIVVINSIGDFLLVVAKVLVPASTVVIGHIMIRNKQNADYEGAILILVGLMTFMISNCVFNVYEVAIATIFICFCEDREVNDGVSRPYFMSKELMEFVEKHKDLAKAKEARSGLARSVVAV